MTTSESPPDGGRLPSESLVLDLHTHAPGFVPPPFGRMWRAVTPAAPAVCGLDALAGAGIDAVVAAAVGDPVVTRCYLGRSPRAAVAAQLDDIERQTRSAGAVVVTTSSELLRARVAGTPAVLLGLEGADAIGHDLDAIDAWHGRGVRLVGLVHLGDNSLGRACLTWRQFVVPAAPRQRSGAGLTPLGRRVVERMNRLGMLVDLAHCSSATLHDVVDVATAPVVASHTGARALQDFPRYLTDGELRAVAGTGGVVGLWPYRARHTGVRDLAGWTAHARHIADTIGPAHLAIGTDMNGLPGAAAGYRGPHDLPALTQALLTAGFDADEVAGILGLNALRVLQQVERHARRATGS